MTRRAIPAMDVAGAAKFANSGSAFTVVVVMVVVVTVVAVVVVTVVVTQGSHKKVPEVSVRVFDLVEIFALATTGATAFVCVQ